MEAEHTLVPHYGVHITPDGIAYLQQGRGGANAVGLRARSPFYVRLPYANLPCNHQIALTSPVPDPTHWNKFRSLLIDPLVEAMLPVSSRVPNSPLYLPSMQLNEYIVTLSRLTSPIYSIVNPIWMIDMETIQRQLSATNIQPLVLIDFSTSHTDQINRLYTLSLTSPRRLIMVGKRDVVLPSGVIKIESDIAQKIALSDLTVLPLEQLGAMVLRRHMRRHQLDAPLDAPMEK